MGHREELLAAARRCLAERGWARTTARDLVAASHTNLASIGYHFGSKDALLAEALAEAFDEWAERVRALTLDAAVSGTDEGWRNQPERDASPGPVGMLLASWGAIRDSLEEFRGLSVAFVEALAQAERQPELRAQLAATYRRSRAHVAAMVTEALPSLGERRAASLAAFQIALGDGLLVQWLLDPANTPSAAELVDALSAVLPAARDNGSLPGPSDHDETDVVG
jgi:AcrR family transcriptional regulator